LGAGEVGFWVAGGWAMFWSATDEYFWSWLRPSAWMVSRDRRDALVARLLASAARQNADFGMVLEALARDGSFASRKPLQMVAWGLQGGLTLSQAAERVPGALRPEIRRAIALGEATGTLPEQLRLAASLLESPPARRFAEKSSTIPYLVMILTTLSAIFGFLSYYIVPKYHSIFNGFGVEFPVVTRFVLDCGETVFAGTPLVSLAAAGWATIARIGWRYQSRQWNISRWSWVWPSYRARNGTAMLLRQLSLARDRGLPAAGMVRQLELTAPTRALRRLLNATAVGLEAGYPLGDVLVTQGFLTRTEASTLAGSELVGNLRWVLLSLADCVEQRLGFRQAIRQEFVAPALTIGMGLLVGVVCVAFFLPLVKLVNDLS
jgi:type II secretory pathway component PulF